MSLAGQPAFFVLNQLFLMREGVRKVEAMAPIVKDLKDGHKVSDLAKAKGLSKEQFATRLAVNLKPRLEALVDHHAITKAQADRVLARITRGFVPFWDGIHRRSQS